MTEATNFIDFLRILNYISSSKDCIMTRNNKLTHMEVHFS